MLAGIILDCAFYLTDEDLFVLCRLPGDSVQHASPKAFVAKSGPQLCEAAAELMLQQPSAMVTAREGLFKGDAGAGR